MLINELKYNPNNPRKIADDKFDKLVKSIKEFPKMMSLRPMVINADNIVLGGNMRLKALKKLGYKEIPDDWVKKASDLTEDEARRFIIADNVGFGEHDWELLKMEWDLEELSDWGLDVPVFDVEEKEQNKKLSDRFIIPPFSVLDTKQGVWQQRKNYWLSLGIKSEEGRDATFINHGGSRENYSDFTKKIVDDFASISNNISIFDPVLCELAYQWFNVPNGKILDPFAGGSVRGIVAAKLGFQYLGNDLSEKQIIANRSNAVEILQDAELYPVWNIGDSLEIDKIAKNYKADMIFSCPPYAGLEVYSDAKEDISNMPYLEFLNTYREIIKKSCEILKEDRFAVFVVGDVRDKKGFYRNFVSETIMAFWNCGVILYNEMILVNAVGSLMMRAGRYMNSRKVGKQHQNVLVFYKGNPKNIKANYPELDLSYIENNEI